MSFMTRTRSGAHAAATATAVAAAWAAATHAVMFEKRTTRRPDRSPT